MIKALIKVIKDSITRCVTALPLKRNLIPKFMKGGGHKKTMKNDSMSEKEREWNIETIEKMRVFQFPMRLFFSMIGPFHSVGCDSFSRRC
jgi:hypothetical protein